MDGDISDEQLWSWVDRSAVELGAHLAECPGHSARARLFRSAKEAVSRSARPVPPPVPQQIGPYAIRELMGEGGQGRVYLAEQSSPRRLVALKVLACTGGDGEQAIHRFEQEVQALAQLVHPGIATVYEAGRGDGLLYYAMELVQGKPLHQYVHIVQPSLEARLRLFTSVCAAVEYAHRHGIIHRDLKPANILVDEEGRPKVVDFGLARWTHDTGRTASSGAADLLCGTLAYMSPEQACGCADSANAQSDVYALGVILYELVTGRLPHILPAALEDALCTICEEPPLPPGAIQRSVRGDLELIVLKAMARDPQERYASVGALAKDIKRYLAKRPISARRASLYYPLRCWVARNRGRLVVTTGVAALFAVAVLTYSEWSHSRAAQSKAQADRTAARLVALAGQRRLEAGSTGHRPAVMEQFAHYPTDPPEVCLAWAQIQFQVAQRTSDEELTADVIKALRYAARSDHAWAFQALLAEVYQATNAPALAAPLREQADRATPRTAEAAYVRSFTTLDPNRAAEFAELAVERDPMLALAWERLTYLSLLQGKTTRALQAVDRLLKLHPGSRDHEFLRAAVTTYHHDYPAAIRQYSLLLAREESIGMALRGRALAYLCQGELEKALGDYDRAVVLRPHDHWVRRHRASVLWMCGRPQDAEQDLIRFCEWSGHPEYAHARLYILLRDRVDLLRAEGRVQEAEAVRERATAWMEDSCRRSLPDSWLTGILLCLSGQLAPQQLVERAAALKNLELLCEAYYYAGEACRLAGHPIAAEDYFRQCLETGLLFDPDVVPPDPMTEYHLARWRLSAGNSADNHRGIAGTSDSLSMRHKRGP